MTAIVVPMRQAVSFIAILALLALSIIAVFSLSGPGEGSQGIAGQIPRLGPGGFRVLLVLVGAALAISLGFVIVDAFRKRRRPSFRKSEKRNEYSFLILFLTTAGSAVVFTVMMAFALSLFAPEDLEGAGLPTMEEVEEEIEEEPAGVEIEPTQASAVQTVQRDLTGVLTVLGIVAMAVVAYLAYSHMKSVRRANVVEDEESFRELGEDLARSAVMGLDKILSEPDHRKAIIAAYAHMEATLANHGFPRDESQTPIEYMETTLRRIEAGHRRRSMRAGLPRQQLLTLTRLYEVAKFSLHELTALDRQSALDSLRGVEASAPAVAEAGARG